MDAAVYPTQTHSIAEKIKPAEKKLLVIEATQKEIYRGLTILWLVSTVFLFLRILLEALGSDTKSLFAVFIYFISNIFLFPFFGILPRFASTIQPGRAAFDAPAFLAIFCYTILILLAAGVTAITVRILKTGKQVDETVKKNNPIDPTVTEEIIK